jgi:hypothetical protein
MPTTHDAQAELARRAENKARKARGLAPKPFPTTADAALFRASRAELQAMTAAVPEEFDAAPSEVFSIVPTPVPPTTTKATATPKPKPLTRFQKMVNADPAKYGEGFGAKRRQRGLAPLTTEQREARKVLYATLESNGLV